MIVEEFWNHQVCVNRWRRMNAQHCYACGCTLQVRCTPCQEKQGIANKRKEKQRALIAWALREKIKLERKV